MLPVHALISVWGASSGGIWGSSRSGTMVAMVVVVVGRIQLKAPSG